MDRIEKLTTEQRNERSYEIDQLDTLGIVDLINKEDKKVIEAVHSVREDIAAAVDTIYQALRNKGRLIYIGAGTSGRLGVLDASEWLPTYGVGKESVIGMIAGGDTALRNPIEGAEDHEADAFKDLKSIHLNSKDIVCAIASSGRTPYCVGGLKYAKELGCKTVSIANVKNSEIGKYADHVIEAVTGAEVITGSTRMKAGSAQKMILNIISTTTMIKSGKVYGNLMVDLNPVNEKLVQRAQFIIREATGVDEARSLELLKQSKKRVKEAIVMELCDISLEEAIKRLDKVEGRIHEAIKD